jgi:predicted ferric reductase
MERRRKYKEGRPAVIVTGCPVRSDIHRRIAREVKEMLWTIALILLVLWALGLITSYTMGGFIHILLIIAVVVVLIRIIQGRRIM